MQIKGLSDSEAIRVWTGVRDDPFIFPRFFGTNIVAMVLRIPISSFPEGQQDWLIWGTSRRGDKQIDHVGRSNRTMLPRLDRLNKLPPNKHVAALTCAQGDCLLWELSFADSKDWPRKTTNDKPFLDNFPYLAEPWPDKEPAPMPGLTTKNKVLLVILVTLIVLLLVVPWVLYIRCRRGVHAAEPT
jgi:hypothetical protein